PERRTETPPAGPDRLHHRADDDRRAPDRAAQLRVVPAAARLVLRAAVGRPARRLARLGRALHAGSDLLRAGLETRANRRLAGRFPALPLAPRAAARPLLVGGHRGTDRAAESGHRSVTSELRGVVRAGDR